MPSSTKIVRPSGSSTKIARATAGSEGRFGIARFGKGRFGTTDPWQAGKVARPAVTATKSARPV